MVSSMAKMWLMVRSTADFPGLYAPIVSSRKSRRSRSCASESPTILSRWESSAWRMEIGTVYVTENSIKSIIYFDISLVC